eukprot:1143616-Pelagomonas_calceolata.AAC.4
MEGPDPGLVPLTCTLPANTQQNANPDYPNVQAEPQEMVSRGDTHLDEGSFDLMDEDRFVCMYD